MSKVELVFVCVILFIVTGVLAYVTATIIFRNTGRIGRNESLWEYFRGADQKNGNIVTVWWAVIWIIWMIVSALIVYLVS